MERPLGEPPDSFEACRSQAARVVSLDASRPCEKPFSSSTITVVGHQNIDHVNILIHRSPEVEELAVDLNV